MADFINTIDALGDDVVMDSIIDRTITEFKDDQITSIGGYAFRNCTALTEVDLPTVTSLGSNAFYGCTALNEVIFPNVTTIDADVFNYCSNLSKCDLPKLVTLGGQSFARTTSLESIYLPEVTSIGHYAFAWNNGALKKLVCPKCSWFGRQSILHSGLKTLDIHVKTTFESSSLPGLTSLILRSMDGVSTLKTTITNDNAHIYVPSTLVDSYKSATNWSTYADKFRALEDHTVDGTITGELDETKI